MEIFFLIAFLVFLLASIVFMICQDMVSSKKHKTKRYVSISQNRDKISTVLLPGILQSLSTALVGYLAINSQNDDKEHVSFDKNIITEQLQDLIIEMSDKHREIRVSPDGPILGFTLNKIRWHYRMKDNIDVPDKSNEAKNFYISLCLMEGLLTTLTQKELQVFLEDTDEEEFNQTIYLNCFQINRLNYFLNKFSREFDDVVSFIIYMGWHKYNNLSKSEKRDVLDKIDSSKDVFNL